MNLVKLCVGVDSVEQLQGYYVQREAAARARGEDWAPIHVTRMWPKRADQILAGGSLYWVIRGVIQARQTIVALDEVIGTDGVRRCGIRMDPVLHRTNAAPRRPFQGWRYLPPDAAPPDLAPNARQTGELPPELAAELADIGVR